MATYVLNIGTDRSHVGKPPLADVEVIEAVCTWLGERGRSTSPAKIEFHQSDSERTAVVSFEAVSHLYADDYAKLIAALEQECIAARAQMLFSPDTFEHTLRGPKAEAWGPFDPTRFIMPGGARLEEPKAKEPLTFHEIKEGLIETGQVQRAVEASCQPEKAPDFVPFFRLLNADYDMEVTRATTGQVCISKLDYGEHTVFSADVFEQIIAAYGATK